MNVRTILIIVGYLILHAPVLFFFFKYICSGHVCANKNMFNTYNDCQVRIMKVVNGDIVNVKGTFTVKLKLHDGVIKTLKNVICVPTLKKNLILWVNWIF